jgi:predicted DNA-binding protein
MAKKTNLLKKWQEEGVSPDSVQLTFRCTKSVNDTLEAWSSSFGVSKSKIIADLIDEKIAELEKMAEENKKNARKNKQQGRSNVSGNASGNASANV